MKKKKAHRVLRHTFCIFLKKVSNPSSLINLSGSPQTVLYNIWQNKKGN